MTQPQSNFRGGLYILASGLTFVVMTSLVKYLGDDFSPSLQAFYRQAVGLCLLAPFILKNPAAALRTARPFMLLFRAGCTILGVTAAFYAYQGLDLALANALSFTRIIWVVLLAALFLGESVTARRLCGVAAGCLGTLVMVGGGETGVPAADAVAAGLVGALLLAGTVTGVRSLTRDHRTLTLLSWSALLGVVLAMPGAMLTWRTPGAGDLGLLALMGLLGVVTQFLFLRGIRLGEASAMAPLDCARLFYAAVLGYFLFGEVPGIRLAVGAFIVGGAVLYLQWSERRRADIPVA
jgi:drug/metabolite transporter (DMT)-like permease